MVEHLGTSISRMRRDGGLLAVCFLDLDGFKAVNDQLGHEAGDEVLIETSRRLRAAVRSTDLVARLGGDEFIVVLDGLSSADDALHVADHRDRCGHRPGRCVDRHRPGRGTR